MNPKLYDELGVTPDASKADIRKAYKARAKQTHPDAGGTDAEFQKVQTAYLTLADEAKRRRYDETGEIGGNDPDNEMARVLAYVAMAINAAVDYARQAPSGALTIDIVALARKKISEGISGATDVITKKQEQIALHEKMLARIKRKGGAAILEPMFEADIRMWKYDISQTQEFQRQMKKAQELLVGYSYKADALVDSISQFEMSEIMNRIDSEIRRSATERQRAADFGRRG